MAVETLPATPTLRALAPSFRRHLLSANRSPKTLRCYLASLEDLSAYLEANGMPTQASAVRREHIESFVIARLELVKPSSVLVAYRALERADAMNIRILIEGADYSLAALGVAAHQRRPWRPGTCPKGGFS